ncbi:hypothetical protein [Syntrophorhabdus aromaticivorans]|uniref:hypothetical protein n=1 Tax=Syntrophorhabdus aromaticivorans TaxID=328301 RepID=UPI00048D1D3C|nr:hypothetical protein [Syntrophorhabdus aromaticivorans]
MNRLTYSGKPFAVMIVCLVFFVFFTMLPLPVCSEDEIRVERHEDKTVYVIDSKKDEGQSQSDDTARSWEMLRDMTIIEKRGLSGKGQDHNR